VAPQEPVSRGERKVPNPEWARRIAHGVVCGFGMSRHLGRPLVLLGVLQLCGFFPGTTGLGLGLWLWLTAPRAIVVLIIRVISDEKSNERRKDGRGVLRL
jgi:hypothetical protein